MYVNINENFSQVILIIGVFGACRADEIVRMKPEHFEQCGQKMFLIKTPRLNTKTKVPRSFTVSNEYFDIIQKYMDLKPPHARQDRFFLNYQNGYNQPISKRKIANAPKRVAAYLRLENPNIYRGK